MICLGKGKSKSALPPQNPPTSGLSQEQLGEVLAFIAQAIGNAASAALGKTALGFAPTARFALPASPGPTLSEAIKEFIFVKSRAFCADTHLKRLRVTLKSFSYGRSRWPLDKIRATDLEKWIAHREWAPKTARNYLTDASIMFNWAIRRGYIERNPCLGIELPPLRKDTPICIHTPDQVRAVLDTARKADVDVCRHLAIRYFAGLRTSETFRLREDNLKLDQGLIEVPAAIAKTRARRLVTIQPNLRAWLDLGGELRPLGPMTVRKVIKLSRVDWPSNVTRHSFASYHLAQFKKINETALEAGHSEQMLFKHYRALVTPDAAKEFWAIVPK